MKTIYKYALNVTDKQEIEMPRGAEILTVQVQDGKPCLWATNQPKQPRTVLVLGTGTDSDGVATGRYIATFQMHGGRLVFHAFEGKP